MTDALRTALYTARWYLARDDTAGALRVVNTMLHYGEQKAKPVATQPEASIAERVAAIAESQVGVREKGANTGERVKAYQAATHLGGTGWAWCAAFVCWCVQQGTKGKEIKFKLPATAGARDLYNWAQNIDNETGKRRMRSGGVGAGITVLGKTERYMRGDIVVYDTFSHCGIITQDETPRQYAGYEEHFTVEGNTNQQGSREGDGVYRKRRGLRTGAERARYVIRIT